MRKKRIPCFGECGRFIYLHFNENGLCRKCTRKRTHAKIRAQRKAQLQARKHKER